VAVAGPVVWNPFIRHTSAISPPPIKVIFSSTTEFTNSHAIKTLAVFGSIIDDLADIIQAVASIPDSLQIWFYGNEHHEEGKAFGCLVRIGNRDPVQRHQLEGGQWWQQTANAIE
jgi:hypothetical protein